MFNYSEGCILVKETITVANTAAATTNNEKKRYLKIYFADCISEKSNAPVDNAKDIDTVMLMCNLTEYSDN